MADSYCRVSFRRINERGYGEVATPAGVVPAWLLLSLTTLTPGLLTLPRRESFVALLCVGWVVLMTLQGHWPAG